MAEFIVTDPTGKEHVVTAPDGATQEQALEFAKSQFGSTQGGAALGNPSIQTQGDRGLKRDLSPSERIATIGGAAALGAGMGAVAPELAQGVGRAISAIPNPAARVVGAFVENTAPVLKAAGRVTGAIAGGLSGGVGETAGQVAEGAGAGPVTAEAARLVGGAVGPEPLTLGVQALKKYVVTPSFTVLSKFKKEAIKTLLGKMEEAPQSLSAAERAYADQLIGEIRGGPKTDAALGQVGSIMGAEGQRVLQASDLQMASALRQAGGVGNAGGYPGTTTEMADVGAALRDTIAKRNEAALAARSQQYGDNAKSRDAIVAAREANPNVPLRQYVNNEQGYKSLVAELKSQLTPGLHSPSVATGYERILNEISNHEKDVFGQAKPITFQALDDVRRKLGDAFRGKPAEGYDAIGETAAKDLYGKISDIQKNFAGGPNGPQAKLLDEYAASTQGLEQFSSKFGKKATALDQYRAEQYATDTSTLPATYFKTRQSIQALKELTGNPTQVQAAALSYADRQLEGKTAPQVREWMGKNSEWLSEVPATRTLIDRFATRLEDAERSMRNAQDFAKQATKDAGMLARNSLPAQRAVDLIKSGDTELWSKVMPAISQSPQAKTQLLSAVRQVVADQATTKTTVDLFSRNLRPFLEQSRTATKAELDFVEQKLQSIQAMKVPEPEKLGIAKRMILQGVTGGASSAMSRATLNMIDAVVPK